jgi:hypothetical protein
MPDELPAEWLATLDAILRGTTPCTRAARFWGVVRAMVRAGWIVRDIDAYGAVGWTLTPWAAAKLGYVLVEPAEYKPRWVRHDLEAAPHPDPPLIADRQPGEVGLSKFAWSNIPAAPRGKKRLPDFCRLSVADTHAEDAGPVPEPVEMPRRRPHRNRKGKRQRQGERRAAAERKAG